MVPVQVPQLVTVTLTEDNPPRVTSSPGPVAQKPAPALADAPTQSSPSARPPEAATSEHRVIVEARDPGSTTAGVPPPPSPRPTRLRGAETPAATRSPTYTQARGARGPPVSRGGGGGPWGARDRRRAELTLTDRKVGRQGPQRPLPGKRFPPETRGTERKSSGALPRGGSRTANPHAAVSAALTPGRSRSRAGARERRGPAQLPLVLRFSPGRGGSWVSWTASGRL